MSTQGQLGASASICTKPDGGCRREVLFVPSAKSGKPMILDPVPVKGVIIEQRPNECPDPQCGDSTWDHDCQLGGYTEAARVVDVYTAHQGTCEKLRAKQERDRKARIMAGLGKDRLGRGQVR
jgi:hypothetical protein